jgi:hypothetical protein
VSYFRYMTLEWREDCAALDIQGLMDSMAGWRLAFVLEAERVLILERVVE